jgi:hypothetical protein
VIWKSVYVWLEKFKRGQNDDVDDAYCGLPATATFVEVMKRINWLIRYNRVTEPDEITAEISTRPAKHS